MPSDLTSLQHVERAIRQRFLEERRLFREVEHQFVERNLKELVRYDAREIDFAEQFFLDHRTLQEPRTPTQLARWMRYAAQRLAIAVQRRKYWQRILDTCGPTAILIEG
jgi:hypothetical protein